MIYLWIFLGALALICSVTLCVAGLVRLCAKSFPMSSPVFPIGGLVLAGTYFLLSLPLWIKYGLLQSFVGLGVLCGLLFIQLRIGGWLREIGFLLVCFLSVLMLPSTLPLFELLGEAVAYLVLTLSLYVMLHLFMMMDRVPWFSNLTLLAQGILILFLIQRGVFPNTIGFFLMYAFVATIAISQTVKVYFGEPVLGEFASVIAGFVLGYIWTFVIAKGYYVVPPILFSYSATEVVISALCSWFIVRHFCVPTMPFFIEQAFNTGLNQKHLVRALFVVLILLSFLGLANFDSTQWKSSLFILTLVLFAACFQFKRWAVPKVRFRDLGSDLKQGFSELKKEMMTVPLKKDSPKKKGKKK